MASIMLEAAEAKKRRTGPPKEQELEERLASLRHTIEITAASNRSPSAAELVPGEVFSESIPRITARHRRALVREWLRLASLKMKMDLDSSGMSESERSAEALPYTRIMPGETYETRRPPTWQEHLELKKLTDRLLRQIGAIGAAETFATEQQLLCRGEAVTEEFLRIAEARQRALRQEYMRLNSLKKDPDLSDMKSEPVRAAEAERLRHECLQEARLLQKEGDPRGWSLEGSSRILDFDAKQGGEYYNSVYFVDLATFDHQEESPVGPMKPTDGVLEDKQFGGCAAINILSVKIACSDIDFPIQVYGTVVARDCIDYKRVYLFRRDTHDCQLINSENEALILTGPKRGLALAYRDDYVETDLWVKDRQGHCRQFSKGIVRIPGTATQSFDTCEAKTVSLATRLSTVDVMYDVVKCAAVEATIAVEVIQGEFYGVMAALTTSSKRRTIVLYDSKVAGGGNCHGVIPLMRPAVSVYVKDKLMILVKTAAGDYTGIKYTPYLNGAEEYVLTLSDTTMRVKVAWSMHDD